MPVRPDVFEFEYHQAFCPSTFVEVRGGTLVVSQRAITGETLSGTKFQVSTSDDAWTSFWDAADFLDIWSWKNEYEPMGRDGLSWCLRVTFKNRTMDSSGANSYPAYSHPSNSSSDQERFGLFVFALGELLKHEWSVTRRS